MKHRVFIPIKSDMNEVVNEAVNELLQEANWALKRNRTITFQILLEEYEITYTTGWLWWRKTSIKYHYVIYTSSTTPSDLYGTMILLPGKQTYMANELETMAFLYGVANKVDY